MWGSCYKGLVCKFYHCVHCQKWQKSGGKHVNACLLTKLIMYYYIMYTISVSSCLLKNIMHVSAEIFDQKKLFSSTFGRFLKIFGWFRAVFAKFRASYRWVIQYKQLYLTQFWSFWSWYPYLIYSGKMTLDNHQAV